MDKKEVDLEASLRSRFLQENAIARLAPPPHNGPARTRTPECRIRSRHASLSRRGAAGGARTFGLAGERFADARRESGREALFPVRGGGTGPVLGGAPAGMVPDPQQFAAHPFSYPSYSGDLLYHWVGQCTGV